MNENNEMKSSETCDDTESGIFDKPGEIYFSKYSFLKT